MFASHLFLLDEHLDGLLHEVLGHVQAALGHGRRQQQDLGFLGHDRQDVLELFLEAAVQHLVRLVDDKHPVANEL